MLIVAIIDLPDTEDGTDGDAPDRVAEGVLGRVQDEAGYSEHGGNPYTPAEVTVHALIGPTSPPHLAAMYEGWVVGLREELDTHAAATAHGHGPL